MITAQMFARLYDMIFARLGVSATDCELVSISTDFNHRTGSRTFRVTIQLPDGSEAVHVIVEPDNG